MCLSKESLTEGQGLLLVYDIFWVFGPDVMLTVATKFDGPIKLLFPKNALSGEEWKFSLLGLGDIVLPGLFIAFLYRFDLNKKNTIPWNFYVTLVSYFLGLTTTIAVMHIYKHGQVSPSQARSRRRDSH